MCYEKAFDAEMHPLAQAIRGIVKGDNGAEIPLQESGYLSSRSLEELDPMERPLAMATKLLDACAKTGRVRLLHLLKHSECLLRFRHLVHVWIK